MLLYKGRELCVLLEDEGIARLKRRFCYEQLKDYTTGPNNRRLLMLYGLRHTGKTVMMKQMIQELDAYKDTCYIVCDTDDDVFAIARRMNELPCHYFFLDEVTYAENFIRNSHIFAEGFALLGKKVIMAGDDSLGFYLSQEGKLLDRCEMLHTTYISFKEHNYLLGKGLDDYIVHGGILTDWKNFHDGATSREYINSAIADNIQHSLENWKVGGRFGALFGLYEEDLLTAFINQQLLSYNNCLNRENIRKMFRLSDVCCLEEDTPILASAWAVREVREYLEILDVIRIVPENVAGCVGKVLFTQPWLKYSQAEAYAATLLEGNILKYTRDQKKKLADIFLQDVKVKIMEDIILYMSNPE